MVVYVEGKTVDGRVISLHIFPSDRGVRRVWLQSGRLVRKDFIYTKHSYVISIQNNQDPDWILRCNYLGSPIAGKQINSLDENSVYSCILIKLNVYKYFIGPAINFS